MTNRREKTMAVVAHKGGPVPIDFGSTGVTGMHCSCVAELREHYGLEKRPVKVHEPYQMLGLIEEDLQEAMGVDVTGVFARGTLFGFPIDEGWKPLLFNGQEVLVPQRFNTTMDANGDMLMHPEGDLAAPPSARMPKDGYFFDTIIRQKPIDEDHLNVSDNTEEFTPVTQKDLDWLATSARKARASGRYVVASFGNMAFGDIALVPAPFLKDPKGIRDVAEWYMSTSCRRDYIHQIFDYECEMAISNLERIVAAVGDNVDAVFTCGNDFGSQTSTFCSVAAFRELYFPYYKRLNEWIHSHTQWKVLKHSCGAVERFIESFADCGIDMLTPVQCSATGMDPELLKQRHGDRIVFWGGGVDTQKTLPFGTPAEIREQVLRRCEIFSQNGGFVFCSIHNIQACTPAENIVAMLDAVHEFNGR
jgi:hypothetical protein